jgi:hypothetical protein
MQAVQVVLFIVVAALALPLIAYLVIPRLRAGRRQLPSRAGEALPRAAPSRGLVCPTCGREYAAGIKYCPSDARALVAAVDQPALRPAAAAAPPRASGGLVCPACKRSFDGNKRFCPYDAEELVQTTPPPGRRSRVAPPGLAHVLGKICPHCAKRYESDATFCGRDGSELVSIN